MRYFSMFSGIGGFELGIEKGKQNKESRKPIQKQSRSREYIRPIRNISNNKISNTTKQENNMSQDNSWECIGFSEIDKYAIQIYKKHFPNHKNYGNARDINPEELPDFDLLCGGFPCQTFSIAGKRKGFGDSRGTLFYEIIRIAKHKKPRYIFLENVKGLLSADNGWCFAEIIRQMDELGYDVEWQVLNSKHFGVPQNRERVFIIGHLRGQCGQKVFPIRENTNKIQRISKEETMIYETGKFGEEYFRSYNNGTPTLQQSMGTGGNNVPMTMKESKIRRLTPTECERLQGFPDGWTEGLSDTQRYKCLGNAVTVNVIEAIVKNLPLSGER